MDTKPSTWNLRVTVPAFLRFPFSLPGFLTFIFCSPFMLEENPEEADTALQAPYKRKIAALEQQVQNLKEAGTKRKS